MKSSTIRRSALSKESMDVIENLSNEEPKDNNESDNQQENYTPGEYHRENNYEEDNENKAKEIDLLWQTFKSPQFNTNSTFVHVFLGFISGVIVTLGVLALFIMFALNSDNPSKYDISNLVKGNAQAEKQDNIENVSNLAKENNTTIEDIETPALENNEVKEANEDNKAISKEKKNAKTDKKSKHSKADKTAEPANKIQVKKYIIKDGDTVEGIIKHNYGAYTQARADAIMKVNKLQNLDHIGIGQELLLPVEK